MKGRIAVLLVALMVVLGFTAATASAHTGPIPVHWGDDLEFTISNEDLATMDFVASNPAGSGSIEDLNSSDPGAGYDHPDENDTEFKWSMTGQGFRQVQVGWTWGAGVGDRGNFPPEYDDLSMYDSFVLSFHPLEVYGNRPSGQNGLLVNLFMNTGYTDPGFDEPDNYYENTWTWVPECENIVLHLDFDDLGVINRNHVTALGFNLGADDPSYDWGSDGGRISIDTVPEPISMIFFGTGLVGVAGFVARKRMRK